MKIFKFTNEEVGNLCRSLAWMLHAGIATGDALTMMTEDEKDSRYSGVLADMAAKADEGTQLSEVLKNTEAFPDYVCTLLAVGERVGRVEDTLSALAKYYEAQARLEQQLRTALLYPATLLAVMLAIIVVLLIWVLRVFNEAYMQVGSQLTGLAGSFMALGMALRGVLPLLCALFAACLLFFIAMLYSPSLRKKMRIFTAGARSDRGFQRSLNTARFIQALSLGISSGFHSEEAVEVALPLTAEGLFRKRCENCLESLRRGMSLPQALRENRLLDNADCRLLEAGIRSGSGETALEQISLRLLDDSELALEAKLSKIEPTLVLICSLLVGLILLSVMLPLLHIMGTIS